MKDLDELLPKILPFAPGCPVPVAFEHIRGAARTLCEKCRVWRDCDEFTNGSGPNPIAMPYGAVLHEIEWVKFDGRQLETISPGELFDRDPFWMERTDGCPRYFTQVERGTISLSTQASGKVTLGIFVKPSEDCEQLPDFMIDELGRFIAYGALSIILMLPKQNFTDLAMAGVFAGKFDEEISRLKHQHVRGQNRASGHVKLSMF